MILGNVFISIPKDWNLYVTCCCMLILCLEYLWSLIFWLIAKSKSHYVNFFIGITNKVLTCLPSLVIWYIKNTILSDKSARKRTITEIEHYQSRSRPHRMTSILYTSSKSYISTFLTKFSNGSKTKYDPLDSSRGHTQFILGLRI